MPPFSSPLTACRTCGSIRSSETHSSSPPLAADAFSSEVASRQIGEVGLAALQLAVHVVEPSCARRRRLAFGAPAGTAMKICAKRYWRGIISFERLAS